MGTTTTSLEASPGSLRGPLETLSVPFHVGDPVPGFPTPPDASILAPELPEGNPQTKMVALFRQLAERVEKAHRCLVYAGDCMAPLGVLAGLQRRGVSPFLVWFDAHGDFNTWETTPSGYIGGMPIAMLVGRGEQTIVEGVGLEPMDEGRIVIADARDVDADERVALKGSNVRITDVGGVLDLVPAGGPIAVHLDVDVVTPDDMPALRFPAAGGPSASAVETSLRALAKTGRIACVTVACTWDPSRPGAARAAETAERLVAALLGARP
jgi:arginase